MESSGEYMINDVALMTLGGGFRASGVTLRSNRVWGGRGRELNTYEVANVNLRTLLWIQSGVLCWAGCPSLLFWGV